MNIAVSTLEKTSARSRSKVCALLAAALAGSALLFATLPYAQEPTPANFAGVWSVNGLESLESPNWDIVGLFSCRCAEETYAYLDTLLHDPANDSMSAQEIVEALAAHTLEVIADRLTDTGRSVGAAFDLADDPAIQCERFGAFRTALHSDPIEIEVYDDRIVIKGEDLTVDRTVHIDGRGHPENTARSPEGHSIGWFEDGSLVIETVGVSAGLVDDQLAVHNSDQARSVERYTVSPDGRQLNMEFTLHDPVMLKAPLTIRRPRVLTPEFALDRRPCEAIAGQF